MSIGLTVLGSCKVCLDDYSVDKFQVFPCGHCFCKTCVDKLFTRRNRRDPTCPLCRIPLVRGNVHPLVLDARVVNNEETATGRVVEGISLMGKDSKTISVKNAYEKLARIANGVNGDNAARLLQAVEDFRQRIIPLFEELDEKREAVRRLEQSNRSINLELTAKTIEFVNLEKESKEMRKAKATAESGFLEAVATADLLQKKVDELQRNLVDTKKVLAEKERDYKRVKDLLDRQKFAADSREKKMKLLKVQVCDLKTQLQEKENATATLRESMMDLDQDNVIISSPIRLRSRPPNPESPHYSTDDQWVHVHELDFEAMPRPGFSTDWSLKKSGNVLKKHTMSPKSQSKLPLNLDAKGRPTTAVQLGPKSTIRFV